MKNRLLPVCLSLLCAFFCLPMVAYSIITPLNCDSDVSGDLMLASQRDTFTFVANAGERIILRMAETSSAVSPRMELYAPSGAKIGEDGQFSLARINIQSAPVTGTYLLVAMDNTGQNTGSYGLSLQLVKPVCAVTLPTCTSDVSGSLNGDASMEAYSFTANQGEQILLRMAEISSAVSPRMELYAPDGTKIGEDGQFSLARINILSAPATGTYVLVVMDDTGQNTGSYGLSLQIVKESCATALSTCTADVSGSLTGDASMEAYSFTANQGEQIILRMVETTSAVSPRMELYAPNGSKIGEDGQFSLARINIQSAPATGTYILVVMDDTGQNSGSYGLSLQIVKESCATPFTCTVDVSGSLTGDASMDAYSFTAIQGEQIILRMAETTSTVSPRMELYAPNGSKIGEDGQFSLARINVQSAPVSGTYILVVMDDTGQNPGSYGLSLQIVKESCAAAFSTCTADVSGSLNGDASMEAYSFAANQGEQILLRMVDATSAVSPRMELYAPNGSKIGEDGQFSLAKVNIQSAPTTGTYVLVVMDDTGLNPGSYGLSLQILRPACSTVIPECPFNTSGSFSTSGEMQAFVFTASAGDNLTITMSEQSSGLYPAFQVFAPDGTSLGSASHSSSATLSLQNLTASGTYFIVLYDNTGTGTGGYTLSLSGCTDNPNPCVAPALNWQTAPASVCAGSKVALGLNNSNANFNFQLYQNGTASGNAVPGTGASISFDSVAVQTSSTFTVKATLKTDPQCVFDLASSVTVDVAQVNLSYEVLKQESELNNDGRIFLCVKNGAPPFMLNYEPNRGVLTEITGIDTCAASYELDSLRAGFYKIIVKDNTGCADTAVVKIESPLRRRVGFPEKPLLTPNGDGKNDVLAFDGLFLYADDDTELVVYNRYGSVMYEARPYLNEWDATYNGSPVPADTYFYTLRIFNSEGTVYTGFITVIR